MFVGSIPTSHTNIKEKYIMSTVEQIKEQFETFLMENEKHEGGNGAAATRARKALGEIAKLCE